jgi:hypothetical protein
MVYVREEVMVYVRAEVVYVREEVIVYVREKVMVYVRGKVMVYVREEVMVYVREEEAERPCAQTGRRQVTESVELQPHRGMNVDEKMGRELRPVQPLRYLIRGKKESSYRKKKPKYRYCLLP